MHFKVLQKALLLGAMTLTFGVQGVWAAIDLNKVNGVQTIQTYQTFATVGGNPNSGLTFTPATNLAIADWTESTTAGTFTNPTFSNGVTFRLSGTADLSLGGASFTQNTAEPYMVVDGVHTTTNGITWSSVPTFTGSGWVEINQNTKMTFGAAMTFTAPIRIASGATLTIVDGYTDGSSVYGCNITLAGVVSGLGGLTYTGYNHASNISTLTLAASPTVATLTLPAAGTLAGNGSLVLNNGVVVSSNVTLGGNAAVDAVTGGTASISGSISGAHQLTKGANVSTLALSGGNGFNAMTISGGTVNVGSNSALGAGAVSILASTSVTVGFTTSGLVLPNAFTTAASTSTVTFAVPANFTAQINGMIGGNSGKAATSGAGTLVLGAVNTATWTLNGGRVNLTALTAGTETNGVLGGATTVAAATTLGFIPGLATTPKETAAITLNAPLTVDAAAGVAGTLSGQITGTAALIKTGVGGINLTYVTANNSLTGGVLVNAGTLTSAYASPYHSVPTGTSITVAPGASFITDSTARTILVPTTAAAATLGVY